jgi:hypothetical protein
MKSNFGQSDLSRIDIHPFRVAYDLFFYSFDHDSLFDIVRNRNLHFQ